MNHDDLSTDLTRLDDDGPQPLQRIGHYRILQQLGEGGMGVVYEAEQERPVRRKVALKVIKLGMDTAQVVARFESERQALALMSHPNIAGVFDAGATVEGRPFFAMECVKGIPLTDYCDRRALGTRARLELFIEVCEGVQHAHQKGIIHRDIKPSNILVLDESGKPVPKIIDFGIAKATAHRLTERTCFTEMGQLIGTPEYMSPEQAEMSGIDIDTRTDVYQLGVLLYELLTGELPFAAGELRRVGFHEFRRKVLEEEPPRPSVRVTTLAGQGAAPARKAAVERRTLARSLRGDLDWITMRALEKDRTRRYAAVSELAADLRRHLRNEPVLAGPPSKWYRLRKFARRHRAGVSFGAVLVVLLTGFAVTMAVQRHQIAVARDQKAQEAATAQQVSAFLADLFMASDPGEARGREIGARELLDRGATRIRALAETPAVQARLMSIMGDVYASHGRREQARELLEDALEIQRTRGDDPLETAITMQRLGSLLLHFGELEPSRRLLAEALEVRRARLPPDDPRLAASLNRLGHVLAMKGDWRAASALYDEAFAIWERRDPDDPALATMLSNQALLLRKNGDLAAARPLLERALGIRRRAYGTDHPQVEWSLQALGRLVETLGDPAGARLYYEEALAVGEKIYTPPHRKVAESLTRLAILAQRERRPEEAARLHRRAIEIYEATGGFDNPFVLYEQAAYAGISGDIAGGLRLLRQAVVEHDYSTVAELERDPDLAALRDHPGFAAIVAAVDSRAPARSEALPLHQSRE